MRIYTVDDCDDRADITDTLCGRLIADFTELKRQAGCTDENDIATGIFDFLDLLGIAEWYACGVNVTRSAVTIYTDDEDVDDEDLAACEVARRYKRAQDYVTLARYGAGLSIEETAEDLVAQGLSSESNSLAIASL